MKRSTPRRSRSRTLELAGGERLVLDGNAGITHFAADGSAIQTWAADDPEWPRVALRFGLHEAPDTIPPSGREGMDSRLPH